MALLFPLVSPASPLIILQGSCTSGAHPELPWLDLSANVAPGFIGSVKVTSIQTGRNHVRISGELSAVSLPVPSAAKSLPVPSAAKSPLPTAANISVLLAEASPRCKVERVASTVLLCFLATGCLMRRVAAPWHIDDLDCVPAGEGLWGKESCPGTLGSTVFASYYQVDSRRNSCLWFSLPSTEGGKKGSGNTRAAVKS